MRWIHLLSIARHVLIAYQAGALTRLKTASGTLVLDLFCKLDRVSVEMLYPCAKVVVLWLNVVCVSQRAVDGLGNLATGHRAMRAGQSPPESGLLSRL